MYSSQQMYGSQQYGSREAARYEQLSMGQSVSQVTDHDLYGSGMLYASGASVEVAKGYGNRHSSSVVMHASLPTRHSHLPLCPALVYDSNAWV